MISENQEGSKYVFASILQRGSTYSQPNEKEANESENMYHNRGCRTEEAGDPEPITNPTFGKAAKADGQPME
jgi:hypothetical protein